MQAFPKKIPLLVKFELYAFLVPTVLLMALLTSVFAVTASIAAFWELTHWKSLGYPHLAFSVRLIIGWSALLAAFNLYRYLWRDSPRFGKWNVAAIFAGVALCALDARYVHVFTSAAADLLTRFIEPRYRRFSPLGYWPFVCAAISVHWYWVHALRQKLQVQNDGQ